MAKKSAPVAAPETAAQPESLLYLDPTVILADDNTRYNLKETRIQSLMASILAEGAVLEPVEVEPHNDGKGHTHRLNYGFYRHAAVMRLNTDGAGLLLPCIVRVTGSEAARTKRQVAENNERETLSPMDRAVIVRRMLEEGVSRIEIRQLFARPTGGKKGAEVKPMSNSMLNILNNLLELPKGVQEKIHSGHLGIEAAYLLGKVAPDKRAAVLERAEADRLAFEEMEDKDEQKLLDAEKKVTETEEKATAAAAEAETAKGSVSEAETILKAKEATFREIQKEDYLNMDDATKKTYMERLKAAEADVKAAQKLSKDAKNKVAKALKNKESIAELAKRQKEKLAQAQAAAKKKAAAKAEKPAEGKAGVTAANIKKASVKEGKGGAVPLSASDIRQVVKDLMAEGTPAMVAQIGKALGQCFNGVTTTKQLIEDLGVITGERKAK